MEYSGLATDGRKDRSWAEIVFEPGRESPSHYHHGTERYYVVSGNADALAIVDGEEAPLPTGAFLKITPKQIHQIENHSLTEKLVVPVKCMPSWTIGNHILIHEK